MRWLCDYRMHWWQIGLLKIAVLAFGILAGAYFYRFFLGGPGILILLWCLFLIPAIYLVLILPKLRA